MFVLLTVHLEQVLLYPFKRVFVSDPHLCGVISGLLKVSGLGLKPYTIFKVNKVISFQENQ